MASRPKSPWKDRVELLKDISSFIGRHGAFFKQNSKRMSDLFEMSVYNDAIRFYKRKKYDVVVKGLSKDGSFRYKLSPSGLASNFSYFEVSKVSTNRRIKITNTYQVHHNIKVQSAHDSHIYYTADVSVVCDDGVETKALSGGRKHSYVSKDKLVTFFEVKNLNPFPEVMFGFSGLVLEVLPGLILQDSSVRYGRKGHLLPCLVFSGKCSAHSAHVANSLKARYGFNVISGLYINKGQIYSFKNLNEF